MNGLKNVKHRHDDALSRVGWADLERLLAGYYREIGWWVEHAGTGGTGAKFDGGVDLRIRRDAQIVLVQCKHWNVKQVTHNAVHELLGVMVNQGATGAILVSSGEFTRAAIEAAQRHGHVKLIDGVTLRGMLGPLSEGEPASAPMSVSVSVSAPGVHTARTRALANTNALFWLAALICAVAFIGIVCAMLDRTADTAGKLPPAAESAKIVQPTIVVYEPQPVVSEPIATPLPLPPTEAEIRESQRKADEAMRLIEGSTPEM
jgi:restriction system protein